MKTESIFKFQATEDRIMYLQARSTFVKLKIKYHCKNSVVLPSRDQKNQTLQLLLWNDVLIGPYPEANTPLYYNIENNNCKVSKVLIKITKYKCEFKVLM